MSTTDKDPRRVAAGKAGMRARWAGHAPAVVRIDDLSPEQRRLVLALVEAARSNEEAAAEIQTPATAELEGHAHDRPAA